MDRIARYRQIVEQILREYASVPHAYGEIEDETVFDRLADRYLVLSTGFQQKRRVYGVVIHIDIKEGKIWLQCNNTDRDIAQELIAAGVAKADIVLGFHPPQLRIHSGYAVA